MNNTCSECAFCRVISEYVFGDVCACDISGSLIEDEHAYCCEDFINDDDEMGDDYYTLLRRKRAEHDERNK